MDMAIKDKFGIHDVVIGASIRNGETEVYVRVEYEKNFEEKRIPLEQFLNQSGLCDFVGIKPKPEEAAPVPKV